jgi:hypothetical protein
MKAWHVVMRWALRGTIAATAAIAIASGNVLYGVYCLFALVLTTALTVIVRRAAATPPIGIELVLLGLMVSDMTLGNLFGLYSTIHWFDKALHIGSAALIGVLGFLVVYSIHMVGKLRPNPWIDGVAILLVTVGIGAIWELAEYAVDIGFDRATQGAPGMTKLDDTMIDLAFDALGAVIAAIIGPLYMRYSPRSRRRLATIARPLAAEAWSAAAPLHAR